MVEFLDDSFRSDSPFGEVQEIDEINRVDSYRVEEGEMGLTKEVFADERQRESSVESLRVDVWNNYDIQQRAINELRGDVAKLRDILKDMTVMVNSMHETQQLMGAAVRDLADAVAELNKRNGG